GRRRLLRIMAVLTRFTPPPWSMPSQRVLSRPSKRDSTLSWFRPFVVPYAVKEFPCKRFKPPPHVPIQITPDLSSSTDITLLHERPSCVVYGVKRAGRNRYKPSRPPTQRFSSRSSKMV